MTDAEADRQAGLRVLVVDDEAPAREAMQDLLAADELVGQVLTAASGAEAEAVLAANPLDVVFLDIHMPGLSGLEVARRIHQARAEGNTAPRLVFVTADARPAVHAFELEATDYLLKPVRPSRLHEALRRSLGSTEVPTHTGPISATGTASEKIAVVQGSERLLVPVPSIRYVQAHGDYVRIHTAAASHLVRISLSTIEERWAQYSIVRIHRSYAVNLNYATKISRHEGAMKIQLGDVELPVSRRMEPQLRAKLKQLHPDRTPRGQRGAG